MTADVTIVTRTENGEVLMEADEAEETADHKELSSILCLFNMSSPSAI